MISVKYITKLQIVISTNINMKNVFNKVLKGSLKMFSEKYNDKKMNIKSNYYK